MAGFVGTTYRNSSGVRVRTKFSWNKGELTRLIGAAAAVALQKAGLEVRRNTQRGMVGGSTKTGRRPRSTPQLWKVGERDGFAMVAVVRQIPRPDKVSSWSPMAFLRNDVQSNWDAGTQSVVVGPSKAPWLNKLHEFGGAVPLYFRPSRPYPVGGWIGPNVRLPKKWESTKITKRDSRGRIVTVSRGAFVGYLQNTPSGGGSIRLGTRTVRGRGYMEIGLQASLHKIPQQFRNTIRTGRVR